VEAVGGVIAGRMQRLPGGQNPHGSWTDGLVLDRDGLVERCDEKGNLLEGHWICHQVASQQLAALAVMRSGWLQGLEHSPDRGEWRRVALETK
jgi:hypothetical protein